MGWIVGVHCANGTMQGPLGSRDGADLTEPRCLQVRPQVAAGVLLLSARHRTPLPPFVMLDNVRNKE